MINDDLEIQYAPGEIEQLVGDNAPTGNTTGTNPLSIDKRLPKASQVMLASYLSNNMTLTEAMESVTEDIANSSSKELERWESEWTPLIRSIVVAEIINSKVEDNPLIPSAFRAEYLNSDESSFTNNLEYIDHDGDDRTTKKLGIRKANASIAKRQSLRGEKGMMAMLNQLSVVTPGTVRLFDSMLSIVHDPISLDELMVLDDTLTDGKDTIGKFTGGVGLTMPEVYTNRTLWEFLLGYVRGCSVAGVDCGTSEGIYKLLSLIKITDFVSIYASYLAGIHPNGAPINVVCNHPDEDGVPCASIGVMRIDFKECLYHNARRLTTEQLKYLATASSRSNRTESEVKAMQDSIKNAHDTFEIEYPVNDETVTVRFELQNPSALSFIETSESWIDDMVEMISQRQGSRYVGISRRSRLAQQLLQSRTRMHLPFFKSITFTNNDNCCSDTKGIDLFLRTASKDPVVVEAIEKGLDKFLEHMGITVSAIPATPCGTCGELSAVDVDARSSSLIPVDLVATFFTLHLPSMSSAQEAVQTMVRQQQQAITNYQQAQK